MKAEGKAMLYITRKCDIDSAKKHNRSGCVTEPYNYTWHWGEHLPSMIGGELFPDVCEIQADGHELDYIVAHFKNLPTCDRRVVVWKGEMAQFIYDNLRTTG